MQIYLFSDNVSKQSQDDVSCKSVDVPSNSITDSGSITESTRDSSSFTTNAFIALKKLNLDEITEDDSESDWSDDESEACCFK